MQIHLRAFNFNDIDALVEHANNQNIAQNLTNKFPFPYLKADAEAFIALALRDTPQQIKAIEVNGKAVGSIGVHPLTDIYAKNAELGYWIGEAFWGKGLVSMAVKEMINYAFDTFDINRIFARTTPINLASQRVLTKAGFSLEATLKSTIFKNGVYYDELIFGFCSSQNR